MASLTARWTKLASAQQLQRSSHTVNVVGSSIYIFGGELKPREPRDNDLHKIGITNTNESSIKSVKATTIAPSPRVGSASATIGKNVYFFSGRGGVAMAPVDEKGGVWSLDTTSDTWSLLKPNSTSFPEARSYHCMTSNDKDTLYMHAGCPEKGRLGDLWSFNTTNKEWRELNSAPNPPRGGTSITYTDGKLYRMNGFDGQHEVGGSLDVYDIASDKWSTISYTADGKSGPGARSVAALLPVQTGNGVLLVTLFGESDPSSLGHQGAGKMLSDVWAYSLENKTWSEVSTSGGTPDPRGWFDADVMGEDAIVVAGGLGESNERLDDLWMLKFE